MRKDFFPDREADMLTWSDIFRQALLADHAALGVPQALAEEYAVVQQAFADAMAECGSAGTRTSAAVLRKRDCRRAMERMSRQLSRLIQGQPQVGDAQKAMIGLYARDPTAAASPPALPTPDVAPWVYVQDVAGGRIALRVRDAESSRRRRRPRAAAGASIFTFVGEQPPGQIEQWHFHGNRSTTDTTITVDAPPFSKVWVTARWYAPRGDAGPASQPIFTYTTMAGPRLGESLKAA